MEIKKWSLLSTRRYIVGSLVFFSLLCISQNVSLAQSVENVSFHQKQQRTEITYDILHARFNMFFDVRLYVSTDGGKSFYGPLTFVKGDVGEKIIAGKNKKIIWDTYRELPDFDGKVQFKVDAVVHENTIDQKLCLGYKGSPTAPIGFVLGKKGMTGYYISARLNPSAFEKHHLQTNGSSVIHYNETGYYTFLNKEKIQRLVISLGIQFQVSPNLHLISGLGYSQYNLLWNIDQYDYNDKKTGSEWVIHNEKSFKGIEPEIGIFYELKSFFISSGIVYPNFEWLEFTLSTGFIFGNTSNRQ